MSDEKEDWQPHITVTENQYEIWYTGDITLIGVHNLIKNIGSCIDKVNPSKSRNNKVTLFLQSGGGCVSSALLLYDYLNLNSPFIKIVGLTKLCSCATLFLFTKCDTYVYPSIYVLFHPITFDYADNQDGVDKRTGFNKFLIKRIDSIYASKNLKIKWHTVTTYLYAEDLLKKGIICSTYNSY